MTCRRATARFFLAPVLLSAVVTAQSSPVTYDLVIRHGTVIDGSGSPRYLADVAVDGSSIARVGDLAGARANVEIDATGLFVTPGFINIHSHATPDGLTTAANMLTQGVTTEIVNADGGGPLDLNDQLSKAATRGLAVNAGADIGFNSIWQEVVGAADRRPTSDDVERMRHLVSDGLAAGAWGISAGLDYKPAYFAQTEEIIRVVEVARTARTLFTNHDRVTPESGFSGLAGMTETLTIGERTGVAPVITHMKIQGNEQGRAEVMLSRMRQATARGTYAAADVYPYLAGQTSLVALIIPGWAQDGGREAMLRRFADSELRARIVREAEIAMNARFSGGAAGVTLPESKQELTTVMREMQVSAGEAVVRLLERGDPRMIARFGVEADLVKILQNPTSSIVCDCGAVAAVANHPRAFGTFPRVLGRYVREQQVLTWEDAVRKMTGLPAATIGMVDRGLLASGMAADVVVFDPATVIDRSTYEEPTLFSAGIRTVLVNGQIAMRDGKGTAAHAGQALRRSTHMPTRPQNAREARAIARQASSSDMVLAMDVRQDAGARHASGTFQLTQPSSRVRIEMTEFGHLQIARDWASFSGRARLRPGEPERSMTVILDGGDLSVSAGDVTFSAAVGR